MNDYRKKIKDATEKMMALVAELSMKQALAIELQKEVREKEDFIFSCSSRMEKGLPLKKEIEREWLKVLRDEEMYAFAIAEKSRVSFGFYIAYKQEGLFLGVSILPKCMKNFPLYYMSFPDSRWKEVLN